MGKITMNGGEYNRTNLLKKDKDYLIDQCLGLKKRIELLQQRPTEKLHIHWQTRYVDEGVEEPDEYNRWMIEGNLKIDCSDITPYEWAKTGYATVAYIKMKGTANSDGLDHPSLPKFSVKVCNVLERGSLFNTGYGNTVQFFDTVDQCKTFAERVMNFHYDMLLRAEKI